MVLAHAGIGAGTLAEILRAWTWDPTSLITISLALFLYTVGLVRSPGRQGRLFPLWRRLCFYLGMFIVFLALISPIDALTDHLFWAHMSQHMLLTMFAAPLIMLGTPVVPMMRGLPRAFRKAVIGPIARNHGMRKLFSTLVMGRVAFVVYFGTIWLWHVPFMYELALQSEFAHILEHTTFISGALLFWWVIIDQIPFRSRMSYPARILYLFASATPNGMLGAFLAFSPDVWYTYYANQATRLWGFMPIQDQNLSGLLMWIPSWMMFMMAAAIVFFIMMAGEERELRRREGEYNPQAAA